MNLRRSTYAGLALALSLGLRPAPVTAPVTAPAARTDDGGYRPMPAAAADTTRERDDSLPGRSGTFRGFRGTLQGLLSIAGLPPVAGQLELTPGMLLFRTADGLVRTYPLFHQVRGADGALERRPAVSLLSVEPGTDSPLFLFHFDGAVFETTAPGLLRELADSPAWLDSLGAAPLPAERTLADRDDEPAQRAVLDSLDHSAYADSLYRLFGRPARPLGLVGSRGRSASRLGEYIASRDSLSLAPGRMTAPDQLRHGLVHELAHRWQRRAPATVHALWRDVAPISDSLRYGYGNMDEQQAEAVAFAVHYAQATAAPAMTPAQRADLLEAYERLVPGTRAVARWLFAQRLYANHPLAHSALEDASTPLAAQP